MKSWRRWATGALRLAVQEGDNRKGCFLAGQVAAMVKQEQPAARNYQGSDGRG